jgi:hypothetical protein
VLLQNCGAGILSADFVHCIAAEDRGLDALRGSGQARATGHQKKGLARESQPFFVSLRLRNYLENNLQSEIDRARSTTRQIRSSESNAFFLKPRVLRVRIH